MSGLPADWTLFAPGAKIPDRLDCGRDLVGSNLEVGHVRDGVELLDTWTVM
ncbi:hypothetical protein DSO57_1020549 [Entomophthora muscae]|uniref:Uncharacterized protein n=1 Tax=Entomophthora muscae TaxID=34485 RepID=A0ACC2TR62_9FUNG|nr:hypothetical protein DSO57_1020549 [Entomophthora muscae]